VSEQIFWVSLWLTESDSLVSKESSSEIITVDDSENSLVDIEVDSNVKIFPEVVLRLVFWEWKLVSLQKDSLRDTGVLNSWLDDVDGVIVKVVEDDTFSNSVVFVWVFNHWFLEISVEFENLSVVLEPLWGDCWDGVLSLIFSAYDTSELRWDSLGHRHYEIWVDVFL